MTTFNLSSSQAASYKASVNKIAPGSKEAARVNSPSYSSSSKSGTASGNTSSKTSSSSGTYKSTTSPTANYGEKSEAVKTLQKQLNAKGANIKEDSMYGPETEAAVKKYLGDTTQTQPTTQAQPTTASEKGEMQSKIYDDIETKRLETENTIEKINKGLMLSKEDKDTISYMKKSAQNSHDELQKAVTLQESIASGVAAMTGQYRLDPNLVGARITSITNESAKNLENIDFNARIAINNFTRQIEEGQVKNARDSYDAFVSAQKEKATLLQQTYEDLYKEEKDLRDYNYQVEQDKIKNDLDIKKTNAEIAKINKEIEKTQYDITTGGGKPPTDAQSMTAGYASRMVQSGSIIDSLQSNIVDMNTADYWLQKKMPASMQSETIQKQMQAERNFVNAVLRKESGAAISPEEFDSASKQYFPQPGDTQAVLGQKKANRDLSIANFKKASGPAWDSSMDGHEEIKSNADFFNNIINKANQNIYSLDTGFIIPTKSN